MVVSAQEAQISRRGRVETGTDLLVDTRLALALPR